MSTYKKMHVNIQKNAFQHALEISTCMSMKSTCHYTKNCMSTCPFVNNMHVEKNRMSLKKSNPKRRQDSPMVYTGYSRYGNLAMSHDLSPVTAAFFFNNEHEKKLTDKVLLRSRDMFGGHKGRNLN
jgi:hypothetical protein